MSDTRAILQSLDNSDNKNKEKMSISSTSKRSFTLRPGEGKKILLPLGVSLAGAVTFALPSIVDTVFSHSLLPSYSLKALYVGGTASLAWFAYGRIQDWNKPTNEIINPDLQSYATLVKINGMIDEDMTEKISPLLLTAFEDKDAKGVVIKINSPGGSPVQSSIIYETILKLKQKYKKTVIAVGEDKLASGAYYIAAAADKIYVNPSTLTGSIGVITSQIGCDRLASFIGIESRVYTAGAYKNRLNMFKPEDQEDIEKIKSIMQDIHKDFKNAVLKTRKDKLKSTEEVLFSGDFWSGSQAVELGLADELGNVSDVLEKEFQATSFKQNEAASSWMNFKFFNLSKFIKKQITTALDNTVDAVLQQPRLSVKTMG